MELNYAYIQERIHDFWKGGSYIKVCVWGGGGGGGGRFADFISFFLNIR